MNKFIFTFAIAVSSSHFKFYDINFITYWAIPNVFRCFCHGRSFGFSSSKIAQVIMLENNTAPITTPATIGAVISNTKRSIMITHIENAIIDFARMRLALSVIVDLQMRQ